MTWYFCYTKQAYKVDMDAHTEEIRQKLLEEMSQKENVIIQLNSLVKAERQNMDNDHLGYNKYMTYLLATVNGLKEQEKTLKKVMILWLCNDGLCKKIINVDSNQLG